MTVEFDYIAELTQGFFSQARIQESFNLIFEQKISGWEIWMQIEFASYLARHQSKPEWHREVSADYDRRMEKIKFNFRPDFLIRKSRWALDSYIALEMKQHPIAAKCISNMSKDWLRIEKVRQSSVYLRDYYLLGVYKHDSRVNVHEIIKDTIESNGYEYNPRIVAVEKIPGCQYEYCIF